MDDQTLDARNRDALETYDHAAENGPPDYAGDGPALDDLAGQLTRALNRRRQNGDLLAVADVRAALNEVLP